MNKAILLFIVGAAGVAAYKYQKDKKVRLRKKVKARKRKKQLDNIKRPYYQIADGLFGFVDAIPQNDKVFVKKGLKLTSSFREASAHLNENYIWD